MSSLEFPSPDEFSNLPAEADRRSSDRYSLSRHPMVFLLSRPDLQPQPAVIHDIGRKGIGLITTRRFEPGTLLGLQFREKTSDFNCILSVRVRHSLRLVNGKWFLGCRLTKGFSDDELIALLEDA